MPPRRTHHPGLLCESLDPFYNVLMTYLQLSLTNAKRMDDKAQYPTPIDDTVLRAIPLVPTTQHLAMSYPVRDIQRRFSE